MKKEVDFNIFKAQILEEIKAGKPLFGKWSTCSDD